jgi:hypothetical protein
MNTWQTKNENWVNLGKERYYYESVIGKRVTDHKWWTVRRHLKKMNLNVTENNLMIYFNVLQLFNNRIDGLVTNYDLIVQYGTPIKNASLWTGKQFKEYLKNLELLPQNLSTFTRWFDDLGGYASKQQYDYRQLFLILAKAVIYKSKKENN